MRPNVRTGDFRKMLGKLPAKVQEVATASFLQFQADPKHPGLAHHALDDVKRGKHRDRSFAVSVGGRHRAIYAVENGRNVWYWIGSHEDYNVFTGRK